MPFRVINHTNPLRKTQRTKGFLIERVMVANPLQTSPRHRTDTVGGITGDL
jgi:hypothetical protein